MATDAVVSFAALLARVIVLVVSYAPLIADDNATTARLEIVGVVVSSLHLLLRYALHLDLSREAPLTKLGGPMSVVDCTSAVLLLFSDAPLLSADSSKFSSVGRILISILTSLAVFTRCAFSAATVSAMAVSATNGARKELTTHKMVLNIAVFLWMVQAMISAGNVALLFVRPAAVAVVRSSPGPTSVFRVRHLDRPRGRVAADVQKVSLRALEEVQRRHQHQDRVRIFLMIIDSNHLQNSPSKSHCTQFGRFDHFKAARTEFWKLGAWRSHADGFARLAGGGASVSTNGEGGMGTRCASLGAGVKLLGAGGRLCPLAAAFSQARAHDALTTRSAAVHA